MESDSHLKTSYEASTDFTPPNDIEKTLVSNVGVCQCLPAVFVA